MKKFVRKKTHPKKLQNTAKNGLKQPKNHTQSFNYTSFIFDSDGEFYTEFNDANPRAVKIFCKKLYPKKALQKNKKWPKTRKKTLLYI